MRSLFLLPLLAGLGFALPQNGCSTVTAEVIVPTTTATYSTTAVITEHPTTARDLGTFTLVTTLSSTKTLLAVTSTIGTCQATDVITVPSATTTVYGNSPAPYAKRGLGRYPRDACTVTVTTTTTYGQTQTWADSGKTSTYLDYTAFTQATVTSTKTGGTAYAIATSTSTTTTFCAESTVTQTDATTTVTLDTRCSPSAMISAYNNYGIEWLSDTPASGATYETNTTDASVCCQMCAVADQCAASAWDIRSGICKLEFAVDPTTGDLNCGEGLLGYYDAGPNHPMAPGTGWFVAELCGNAEFGSAAPDDGT